MNIVEVTFHKWSRFT